MTALRGAPSRTLEISSPAIPVVFGRPALEAIRLSGHEGVNSLFEYELLLRTPDSLNTAFTDAANFDLNAFLGYEICCTVQLDGMGVFLPGAVGASTDGIGSGVRQINALITDVQLWGEEGRDLQYRLTLRPWLHLAALGSDCRIFQNKTVVDVLDALLGRYPFPFDKRLSKTYPPRDYQTQFNENDLEFFERLCQKWGISYFFEHSDGKHRLVLSDERGAYKKNESAAYQQVDYHPPGWKADAEYIHSFVPHHQLTSGRVSLRDYDYTRPRADLSVGHRDPRPTGQADGEVYRWHDGLGGSHYAQPNAGTAGPNDPHDEGREFARLRMEAQRTHGARARASGNLRGMVPGCTFELRRHPRTLSNTDYLILDTHLVIEDLAQSSQIRDAAAHRKQQWRIEVDFTAHPMNEPLRPALTRPKPRSHNPQSALVVGPPGQNLWTDALGRIKVQFPWDREGQRNQHSSCWVRVSNEAAGNQTGAMQVPRIGQEVLISFIADDPDLPLCTARLYNQNNPPPWELPGQAALSGLRSRELRPGGGNSAAGRSNHLILDDTDQKIQVQLKSDHLSSSLSMGHIARIEDNAGRKDARGEGFELRSDGHGAVRAKEGLLLTTEARPNAASHVKDMGETTSRLNAAHDQHEGLSQSAQQGRAHVPGDQDEVVRAIKSQNDSIKGVGRATGDHFSELTEPHLVIASPAGIESTTAKSTHIASLEHNALTSGGHTSISAGKSFLVSVKEAIRLFSYDSLIKLVAARDNIDIAALTKNLNLFAKLDITMDGDNILIRAKHKLTLAGGATSMVLDDNFTGRTLGKWVEHGAGHSKGGPAALNFASSLPTAGYQGCATALKGAAATQSGTVALD